MPRLPPCGRLLVLTLLLMPLLPRPVGAGEVDGIRWESDVGSALARAAAEGRPLLLALNALEGEQANEQLARVLYRSEAWGAATEDWVCLPCNANLHGDDGCARFAGIPCATHQAALRLLYRLRRLPPDRAVISPAHAILDPDGRLVWDKEYFTGVVGPRLFDQMLGRLAPSVALDRAARVRGDEVFALESVKTADLATHARAWLERDDPLAAAALIVAADQELDGQRRLALLGTLAEAGETARSLVQMGAYEASLVPEPDLDVFLAWLEAARALDPEAAYGHAMRAGYRIPRAEARRRVEARARGSTGTRPPEQRAAALELAWLLGERGGSAKAVPAGEEWARRQARARRLGLGEGRVHPPLHTLAADAPPGTLRGALLEADPEEVRAQLESVRAALATRREERVRIAAALALLGAGLDADGLVASTILAAVFDPVEGADTRREAVRRLGEDPGWNEESWRAALAAPSGAER